MNNEFKKITNKNETRYVLETATVGSTVSGNVATTEKSIGDLHRRLQELKQKVSVPVTQKPRQGPLKPQTGAGAHRDKKKEQKQGKEKHRKPFTEDDVDESGLQYYTGKKKYGADGMKALAAAGRKGANQQELGRIKDRYIKKEGVAEDDGTPGYIKYEQMKDKIASVLIKLYDQGKDEETIKQMSGRVARHLGYDPEDSMYQDAWMSSFTDAFLDGRLDGEPEDDYTDYTMRQGEMGRKGMGEEHNDTFDPKSHAYKTTMKHAKNPTIQQRMAAHDINPGIKGYRDRVDMLKDLERTGRLKDVDEDDQKPDHEISMASNELQSIVSDAKKLLMLVKRYSEMEGLEAWQQSKITKAADYLTSVLRSIGGEQGALEGLRDPKDNPCWKGYKPVGTKKKGGRTVPNCVPKESFAEGMNPEKRSRLNDLIDQYRTATDPSYDSYGVDDHYDPDEVIAQIRQEFGDRIADQVEAGADKMHFPRAGHQYGYDPLGWKKPIDRQTKAGKMYKQDSDYRKNTIKSRYRLGGKSATQEEVGYDEVSPKTARYVLMKLDQGHNLTDMFDQVPELARMAEIVAGEHRLHLDDDIEEIEQIMINDLNDIVDRDEDNLSEYEVYRGADGHYYDDEGNRFDRGFQGSRHKNYVGSTYPSRPQPSGSSSGMYFYNVRPGQEGDAQSAGLRQTKSGKWYSKSKNSQADNMFGLGRYWEPKNEDTNEGLRDPKDNPCWKGYKPVGTKKKGGRTVPNCVPKESVDEYFKKLTSALESRIK